MRRPVIGLLTALALLLGSAIPALGASTSVTGSGSYEKLVVNNGSKALVFKIHAPGGECAIKYLAVKFRDRDGTRYAIDGGCYPGPTWGISLVRGDTLVDCGGYTLTYNTDKGFWTGKVPRTCLKRLGAAVKVTESYVDDYSPTINEVPATRYVAQG